MDGEWVSGLLSENGSSGFYPTTTNLTYKEIFDGVFPYYLSIGMSYQEFWHGEVELVKAYREAYKMRRKENNFNAWLQGRYFYEALCCASPLLRTSLGKGKVKAMDYCKRPYDLYEEDKKRSEEEDAKQQQEKIFKAMQDRMSSINKRFKKK